MFCHLRCTSTMDFPIKCSPSVSVHRPVFAPAPFADSAGLVHFWFYSILPTMLQYHHHHHLHPSHHRMMNQHRPDHPGRYSHWRLRHRQMLWHQQVDDLVSLFWQRFVDSLRWLVERQPESISRWPWLHVPRALYESHVGGALRQFLDLALCECGKFKSNN